MTQNNFRKEPVFGESSVTSQDVEATKTDTAQALMFRCVQPKHRGIRLPQL